MFTRARLFLNASTEFTSIFFWFFSPSSADCGSPEQLNTTEIYEKILGLQLGVGGVLVQDLEKKKKKGPVG